MTSLQGVTLPAILAAFGTLVWMLAAAQSEIAAVRGSQQAIESMGIGTRLTSLKLRLEQIFLENTMHPNLTSPLRLGMGPTVKPG
ncbi:MAG: hypothetical protein ACR2RE_00700 [Geminicoccaceae bacterium]